MLLGYASRNDVLCQQTAPAPSEARTETRLIDVFLVLTRCLPCQQSYSAKGVRTGTINVGRAILASKLDRLLATQCYGLASVRTPLWRVCPIDCSCSFTHTIYTVSQ